MTGRFVLPTVGAPSPVAFPAVDRRVLDNGARVWSLGQAAVPVVSIAVVLDTGTAADPVDRPGLTSLTASLMTEGAGDRDTIELADAVARIGGHLSVDPGPDAVTLSLSTLARHFEAGLAIVADIVQRPRLREPDFDRVRDLRRSRLLQAGRTPGTVADRALLAAVFGDHPYGHGALGTTAAVEAMTPGDLRRHWSATWGPDRVTLLIAGDVAADRAWAGARQALGAWRASPGPVSAPGPVPPPDRAVRVVDRPGSPQSELRVGHVGPARRTPDYHALLALNAVLGGQFTSRINRNLREARAVTYGARSSFEMRRSTGLFSCETSVEAGATAVAVAEILRECQAIRHESPVGPEELARAQASLTRGYARHFETAAHLARALAQLVTYDLPVDTFDRFVAGIEALTPADLTAAALTAVRPEEAAVVVVGDLARIGSSLDAIGRAVVPTAVDF